MIGTLVLLVPNAIRLIWKIKKPKLNKVSGVYRYVAEYILITIGERYENIKTN